MEAGLQLEDEAGEVRRGGVDGLLLLVDLARGEVAPLGAGLLDGACDGRRADDDTSQQSRLTPNHAHTTHTSTRAVP